LEKIIDTALDSVTIELMRKYFRKIREYQRAYREGNTLGKEIKILKKYKSRHRVSESTDP